MIKLILILIVLIDCGVPLSRQNGMTLMVEIENMLRDKKSFAYITRQIDNFKEAIREEQKWHEEIQRSQDAECASEQIFRNEQIEKTYQELHSSNIRLQQCEDNEQRMRHDSNKLRDQHNKYQDRLQAVITTINQVQLNSDERETMFKEALQTLNVALEQSKNSKQNELYELSQSMFHHAISTECIGYYAPALQLIQSLKFHSNSEMFEIILNVLNELKTMVSQKLLKLRMDSQYSSQLLTEQKKMLQQGLIRNANQKEWLKKKIEETIQCVGDQAAQVQQLTTQLNINKDQQNSADSICKIFEGEFKKITESRRNELRFAYELEDMVRKRFEEENRLKEDF